MNPDGPDIRAAILDVDGTLITGTSCERQLFAHLLVTGRLSWIGALAFVSFTLPRMLTGGFDSLRRNKTPWKGLTERDVEEIIPRMYEERLQRKLRVSVLDELPSLKDEGFTPILLSGTPLPLLEELGRRLEIEILIGTALEVNSGRYTGKVLGIHPYGKRKLKVLESAPFFHRLDLTNSTAYGDSWHDRYLLERVGKPVAVSPDRRLRELAIRRGWRIIRE